jgi:hypothetical protein
MNGDTMGWTCSSSGETRNAYKIRMIKLRTMRWAGHVAQMGEKRNVYRTLVGKPEGKREQ